MNRYTGIVYWSCCAGHSVTNGYGTLLHQRHNWPRRRRSWPVLSAAFDALDEALVTELHLGAPWPWRPMVDPRRPWTYLDDSEGKRSCS